MPPPACRPATKTRSATARITIPTTSSAAARGDRAGRRDAAAGQLGDGRGQRRSRPPPRRRRHGCRCRSHRPRTTGPPTVNRPITANPANAAVAAVRNTGRTCGGTDEALQADPAGAAGGLRGEQHRGHREQDQHDVHERTAAPADAGRTAPAVRPAPARCPDRRRWRWWPRRRPARRRGGATDSTTAAVAVPVKMPADRPDSSRPISSSGTLSANRNTVALASAKPSPASNIGRRPIASDQPPERSAVRRAHRRRTSRR